MSFIVGWSHTPFGRLTGTSSEDLIKTVVTEALEHAGVGADEIDEVFLGTFNNGFVAQDFQASLVGLADESFRHTPATRVENACATGSAAIHAGLRALKAGDARRVLVVGVEKMNDVSSTQAGDILLGASYCKEEAGQQAGFAGIFASIAQAYGQKYGDPSETLARISAKNHLNGVNNTYAHIRRDLGFDFCNEPSEKNPLVAPPLRRTDCSLISDGAAALVLASQPEALQAPKAIAFRAAHQVNEFLPLSKRDRTFFDGAALAWHRALGTAKLSLDDLSFVETHDCFTIAELLEYEAMGLTDRGKGRQAIDEGWTRMDGKLPVNPSGGLKSKGHPVGATGVSQHVMAAMQLANDAGDMQVDDAKLAGVFNMGGAAVANYVSILERVK